MERESFSPILTATVSQSVAPPVPEFTPAISFEIPQVSFGEFNPSLSKGILTETAAYEVFGNSFSEDRFISQAEVRDTSMGLFFQPNFNDALGNTEVYKFNKADLTEGDREVVDDINSYQVMVKAEPLLFGPSADPLPEVQPVFWKLAGSLVKEASEPEVVVQPIPNITEVPQILIEQLPEVVVKTYRDTEKAADLIQAERALAALIEAREDPEEAMQKILVILEAKGIKVNGETISETMVGEKEQNEREEPHKNPVGDQFKLRFQRDEETYLSRQQAGEKATYQLAVYREESETLEGEEVFGLMPKGKSAEHLIGKLIRGSGRIGSYNDFLEGIYFMGSSDDPKEAISKIYQINASNPPVELVGESAPEGRPVADKDIEKELKEAILRRLNLILTKVRLTLSSIEKGNKDDVDSPAIVDEAGQLV